MKIIREICKLFSLDGKVASCSLFGSGNIHKTYLIETDAKDGIKRYIIQDFNTYIFKDPDAVINNLLIILDHLRKQQTSIEFPELVSLSAVDDYMLKFRDKHWRCFRFIEDTRTFGRVESEGLAFEGGRAFGEFLYLLRDMDPALLARVIPDFHSIELRILQLEQAVQKSDATRLEQGRNALMEIQRFSTIAEKFSGILKDMPVRIVHNDTKLSNILFDHLSIQARALIDLDTVMPGAVLTDFGDMFRSYTASVPEDEKRPESTYCRPEIFEEIVRGYMEGTRGILIREEKENLLTGSMAMIYMQAVRFLTDHLAGDVYYRTEYPGQNLIRTVNQLNLLKSVESGWNKFDNILKRSIS